MRLYRFGTAISALAVLLLAATPASATFTTYSTRSSMESAGAGQIFTTIDFESFVAGAQSGGTLSTAGITFAGYQSGSCTPGSMDLAIIAFGGSQTLSTSFTGSCIQIDLPAETRSVGFNVARQSGTGVVQIDTLAAGPSSSSEFPATSTSYIFWGISSTTDITSVTLYGVSGMKIVLDDFEIGQAGAEGEVPEAATLALIGSGLVGMRLLRLRRKSFPSQPALQT